MSGGSYNYISTHDIEDVMCHLSDVHAMIERLTELGYAEGVVYDSCSFLWRIEDLERLLRKLQPVWRAVEWWNSGDWGEDDVKEAIAEYEASS